ncbi:MAG: hypothetical protein U0797_17445 [Gemmataceae bacterium]
MAIQGDGKIVVAEMGFDVPSARRLPPASLRRADLDAGFGSGEIMGAGDRPGGTWSSGTTVAGVKIQPDKEDRRRAVLRQPTTHFVAVRVNSAGS